MYIISGLNSIEFQISSVPLSYKTHTYRCTCLLEHIQERIMMLVTTPLKLFNFQSKFLVKRNEILGLFLMKIGHGIRFTIQPRKFCSCLYLLSNLTDTIESSNDESMRTKHNFQQTLKLTLIVFSKNTDFIFFNHKSSLH